MQTSAVIGMLETALIAAVLNNEELLAAAAAPVADELRKLAPDVAEPALGTFLYDVAVSLNPSLAPPAPAPAPALSVEAPAAVPAGEAPPPPAEAMALSPAAAATLKKAATS